MVRKSIAALFFCLALVFLQTEPAQATRFGIVVQSGTAPSAVELHPNPSPVLENDRVLVPLSNLAAALGFEAAWDEPTQTVSIKGDGQVVTLIVGSTSAQVNGQAVALDAPSRTVNDRTMVPLSFVAQALKYQVYYYPYNEDFAVIYVLPYNLVSDDEVQYIFKNDDQFVKAHPEEGYPKWYPLLLKDGSRTGQGVALGDSLDKVLKAYGIPEGPYRDVSSYPSDFTGVVHFKSSFKAFYDLFHSYDLTFENGVLASYSFFPATE